MTSSNCTPAVGLSFMIDDAFRQASLPLFEAGEVEVLEWSFDTVWGAAPIPEWAEELLTFYSGQNALVGHGVRYSILSAESDEYHRKWLACLTEETKRFKYQHISEHFGFMTAGDFHRSAPLPVPYNDQTLALGIKGMRRLSEAAGVPVGLENLAFAFGAQDVKNQGPFLEKLLAPVDGFLVLDLHNMYCQMCNFDRGVEDFLAGYPLSFVRELHVSGGSWSEVTATNAAAIRRDTHNAAVPDEVFDLVGSVLPRCPAVTTIIFEQLGDSLIVETDAERFQEDFMRLKSIVRDCVQ